LTIGQTNFPGQKLAGALVLVYVVLSALIATPYLGWNKRLRTSPNEKRVEA